MVKKLGFAILGTGNIAGHHQKAVLENQDLGAELLAMGHYNPDKFKEIAGTYGVPCLPEKDILAHPDIDVVCIITPSGLHAEQAVAAAGAGKHVIVEKPMALSLEDAGRMIRAAEAHKVKLMVTFQRRGLALFRDIAKAVRAGDLGRLTLAQVTMPYWRTPAYYRSAAWRGTWELDGGGILMCQGIHIIDLLVWYLGDPVEIRAFGGTLEREIQVEDTAAAVLRFEHGAMATVCGTTTAFPGSPHRLELYGTRGSLQIQGENLIGWEVQNSQSVKVDLSGYIQGVTGDDSGASDPMSIKPHGHISLYRDFIQAVCEDRPPLIDGREGRRSLKTVVDIYRAAGLIGR